MLKAIKEASRFLQNKTKEIPEIGIILGTGLGRIANEIKINCSIAYENIPNFPTSTVEGHSGELIFGEINGKNIVAMKGRFHFYEGYPIEQIVLPIRVMKLLGVKKLIVSNASGGVNPDFEIGDIMLINDHINLIPNPLIGKNIDELGVRFPDMSEPYCDKMINLMHSIAKKNHIKLKKGVYVGVTGPTLETPAEYSYFRKIGGDTVGMSTVPEVIIANHMNIPCLAISVITDLGVPGKIKKVTHEDVQEVAEKTEPKLTLLIKELISKI
jgi:purine-nucleoside phosphorylase